MTSPITVSFDGEQTVRTIGAAAERLKDALAGAEAVEIDCGDLAEVDLSFVQLVLSARKTAVNSAKRLALSAPAGGALLACLRAGGFLNGEMDPALSSETRFWMKRGDA